MNMSITSLWERYDRRALPLDVTLLNEKTDKKCTIKSLYFNGEATTEGVVRVYGEYFLNNNPNGASIIVMNNAPDRMSRKHVDVFVEKGYHVLLLDYAGKHDGEGYYTVYPEVFKHANYFLYPDCLWRTETKLKTTCYYVWTTVLLRGITLLESFSETDKKRINVFGDRLGAFQIWKATFVDSGICSAIALNNSGYVKNAFINEEAEFNYTTTLNNLVYAQQCKVPVLIQISTNADDNSLAYMNDLFLVLKNTKCKFSISERCNNETGYMQKDNIDLFLNYYNFGSSVIPYDPEIKPFSKDRLLNYSVKVDDSLDIEKIELFTSQGIENDAYKNWHSYTLEKNGDYYVTQVEVHNNREDFHAFVNVKFKNSLSVSSEIVTNIPLMMGVKNTPVTKSRLVYTTDYNLDEWTSRKGKDNVEPIIKIKKALSIAGITSSTNSLTTYKLGDPVFTGAEKSILQLLLYSKKHQRINFTLTISHKDEFVDYHYSMILYSNQEWVKIDLFSNFFKSTKGYLENWDNAVALTIDSEDTLYINSMIWI